MRLQPVANVRKLKVGGFVFDPDTGEVAVPGRAGLLRLRPRAATLLFHLAERPGQLVSRQELQQLLWGNRVVDAEQGLNACIRDVRRTLGDSAAEPSLIETLPGRGYRLIAPVAPVSAARRPWARAASIVVCVVSIGMIGLWFQRSSSSRPVSRDVRNLFLEAEHLAKTGDAAALSRSLRLLEKAIELEPSFAPAHGKLAQVSFLAGDMRRARAAADRALALDPELAEAHAAVGFLDFIEDQNPQSAQQHLERAVRLDPASTTSRQALAHFLIANGEHHRAIEEMLVALDLDPVDARLRGDASWIFYWARRFPEAAEHARRTLILSPDDQSARVCLFRSLVAGGRTAAAAETLVELARRADLPADVFAGFESGSVEERLRRYWYYLAASPRPSPGRLLAFAQLHRREEAREELAVLSDSFPAIDLKHLFLDPLLDPVQDLIAPPGRRGHG